jgi:hypothetical protein
LILAEWSRRGILFGGRLAVGMRGVRDDLVIDNGRCGWDWGLGVGVLELADKWRGDMCTC